MDDAPETRVRKRAYEIWESEGRPEGAQDKHWRRACEEINAEDETSGGETAPDAGGTSDPAQAGATILRRFRPGYLKSSFDCR